MGTQPVTEPQPVSERQGCINGVLLAGMSIWILSLTLVNLVATWIVEQPIFEDSYHHPDPRWIYALAYGLAVAVPAAVIWAAGRTLPGRRFHEAFLLAGEFAVLMAPARLAGITNQDAALALEIAGILVFLVLRWNRFRAVSNARGLGIALLAAGVLSIPWVLWGALGSNTDILLQLITALLFGLAVSRTVNVAFQRGSDGPETTSEILMNGFTAALALTVMVTALGVSGNQGLLVLSVPPLGWALAALSDRTRRPDGCLAVNGWALALLAALAAFWPMAFVDPDEMAEVISLGPGELIQWAYLAAFVGLFIAILISVVLLVVRAARRRPSRAAALPVWGAAALVWLAALALYFGLGQPGLYGERLFVILKDQADLTQEAQIKDYNQRRTAVYQALVQKADSSQAGIRQTLGNLRIPYQPYYLENGIEVHGGPLVRWWLERRPEVDRVLSNPIMRPLPAPIPESTGGSSAPVSTPWNLKMINADRVWSELGVTGKGILVGQSDTGVQGDHPELAQTYRGQGGKNDYNWFDPWNHTSRPTDIGGHGTHTLGTVLGQRVGVAPGAQWIGCVNLARNLGNPALYLDCMQFMLAPFPLNGDPLHDGRPDLGAQVLNNSWGCPPVEGCDPDALLPAVQALKSAGIFVVASAGNDGDSGCGTVADPPALYAQVYSVGAVDQSRELVDFSSLGPVNVDGSNRVKPDIAAPGAGVLSSFPGDTYAALSGTSMAGPHLAGVVALMWSANPALIGDIDRTIQILDQTAAPYTGTLPACVAQGRPNNAVGYGIVDAYAAVKMAMGK